MCFPAFKNIDTTFKVRQRKKGMFAMNVSVKYRTESKIRSQYSANMPFPYNEQCDLSVFYKNYEYSIFYLFNLFKYAKMCIKFQV